jgi:hypothetical protein
MRKALHYLRDLLRVGLPEDAARIYRVHLPLAECITERARMSSSNRWGPWLALGVRYMECSSTFPPGTGVLRRVAGLPAFFQRRWGSASLWRLPFEAAFRMLRRLLWAHQRCIEPRRAIKTPTRETA